MEWCVTIAGETGHTDANGEWSLIEPGSCTWTDATGAVSLSIAYGGQIQITYDDGEGNFCSWDITPDDDPCEYVGDIEFANEDFTGDFTGTGSVSMSPCRYVWCVAHQIWLGTPGDPASCSGLHDITSYVAYTRTGFDSGKIGVCLKPWDGDTVMVAQEYDTELNSIVNDNYCLTVDGQTLHWIETKVWIGGGSACDGPPDSINYGLYTDAEIDGIKMDRCISLAVQGKTLLAGEGDTERNTILSTYYNAIQG